MALSAEQDKNDLMKLSLKILKKKSKAFKISAEGSKADVVRRIVAKRHTILPTEPDNESNASMNNTIYGTSVNYSSGDTISLQKKHTNDKQS
eukprot:215034_1